MSVKANNSFQEQNQPQIKDEVKQLMRQNSIVHFATDIPLVVVEIPLKNGKIAKLPIFEFSNPDALAGQFVKKYQLDEKLKKPIRKMIEQQMQEALSIKQQQSSSDNPSNQSYKLNRSQSSVQIANQQQKYQQQGQNQQNSQREYKNHEQLNKQTEYYDQNINNDSRYEKQQNKYIPQVSIKTNSKEEKLIDENHQDQIKKDKKNKIGQGFHETQSKNNEQQYQNLKKLKNKDFFTENSETENEQSEFIVNRKQIGKSVKPQNYNDEENKTIQKNRQTQSSALLTKQQQRMECNEEYNDQQINQQKVYQPQRQKSNNNQDNVPSIVFGQQQQTKSILKQNKSSENLLTNNQFNNTQELYINHTNTQIFNNQNIINNDIIEQYNSENVIQNQKQNKKRNEEQQSNVINMKVNKQQYQDQKEDVEYEQINLHQNKSQQSNESYDSYNQKHHQQNQNQKSNYNDKKQQQNKQIKVDKLISKQVIQKNSIQSGQAAFNYEEENQDQNQSYNEDQLNQNNNYDQNVSKHIQQNRNNPLIQQKIIQNASSQQQISNIISSSSNTNTASQKTQVMKNQSQKVPEIQNQVKMRKQNGQDELNSKGGDEDDTEVDELNQMAFPQKQTNSKSQKQTKDLVIQNKQNIVNKSKQIQKNNLQSFDDDIYEDLDTNEDGDFNKIDEASDIKYLSNKQQDQQINRAPNGSLKQNPGNPNKNQQNQIQIPKQVPPFINKRQEEVISSQNVFNKIKIEQNEVKDFAGYVNQNIPHKQITQNSIEVNNNNFVQSSQGYQSPQNYGINNKFQSPLHQQQQQQQQLKSQQNNYMNPYQQSQNQMKQIQCSPQNNEFISQQRMNMQIQPHIHQNTLYQQDMHSNNNHVTQQNYIPHMMNSPISQENRIISSGIDQNKYDQIYQNQRQQQNFQPLNQNQPLHYNSNQFMINNINTNQALNSSFLTNNLVNTSINSSVVNKSLTPRRKIFDDNTAKTSFRNQPIQVLNQLDNRGYEIQQTYTTPQKSGTNTPLRYRNNEQTIGFAGYPSRSISPNQYFPRRNDFYQQSNINSQSLQFYPNQISQRGNQFPQQPSSNNQSMPFQQNQLNQRGVNQINQQMTQNTNFGTIQQNQNYNTQFHPQQQFNNGQNYINPNYNNKVQQYQQNNNTQQSYNINQNEVSSPNFNPPERKVPQRNITPIQNNDRRSPSPTQIISPNNYNFKNMNISLFEQRKQNFQEEFKQSGQENNSSKNENSHNQSNQFAPTIPSTPTLSTQQSVNGILKDNLSNNIPQSLLKPAPPDQFQNFEYSQASENKQKDNYNSNQGDRESYQIQKNNDKKQPINQNGQMNGIMFSLNAQYKDPDTNNIEQLFNLLDTKKQGYITQQSIDYSQLPIHHQLRLELNSLLESTFSQQKNVDFDLFLNTATQKHHQLIQYCNSIFSGKNNQQSTQPPMRPPSFGFAKDQLIFQ